jgi:hypothetical protein
VARLDDLYRKFIFFGGDIRKLSTFPWVTWAKKEHLVHYEELVPALNLIEYGDIGLHRDRGYLSNVAIPGFMKHAWIHTEAGLYNPRIVEALSEGVVKRHPLYPLYSDYTIILTPRDKVEDRHRRGACLKANQIVGRPYDHNFRFNIKEEIKYYEGAEPIGDLERDLDKAGNILHKYDIAFSCTEVVAYAWWHLREQLGIYRDKYRGKPVIIADTYMNRNWKIRWASESVTIDVAERLGLHEEGLSLVEEWE